MFFRIPLFLVFVLFLAVYLEYPPPAFSQSLVTWTNKGKFTIIEGQRIFFIDHTSKKFKNKDTLLLLHGFPTSSYDWHKIWSNLTLHFKRVIALDFLGYGLSDKPLKRSLYKIENQARIVEVLLATLNVTNVHVLAHDVGDTILQELLYRFNERNQVNSTGTLFIETACFLNGGLFQDTYHPRLIQKILSTPYLAGFVTPIMNFYIFKMSFLGILGTKNPPTDTELRDFWSLIVFKNGHLVLPDLLQYMGERVERGSIWTGALIQTMVPVHVLYGPADPINPPDFVPHLRSKVPKASLDVLAHDVGHYPQLEDPDAVVQSYFNFVARI